MSSTEKKQPVIVSQPSDYMMSLTRDGVTITSVTVKCPDGTTQGMFVSDSHPGLFRMAFLPWDATKLIGEIP